MWEDNSRKHLIINIVLVLVIAAILAGLFLVMLHVRRQTQEHDEQLSEMYVQQKQQQDEARQESVGAIQAAYDRDMQTVADYLPGIVCWGDSTTLGSSGNISYPAVLKVYLDTYFCDIYDFRSTVENAEDYARLKWDDYKSGGVAGIENLILAERLRELAFEGKRWYDLLRYGYRHSEGVDYNTILADQKNYVATNADMLDLMKRKFVNGNAVAAKLNTEPRLYMPVPLADLKICPVLKQNPGYSSSDIYSKNY